MNNKLNLASARFGAAVVAYTDEFFAACARMLQDSEPVFIDDKYDSHGKWMDGWETRRRRQGGHDSAVVKLAYPGVIHDVDLDTRHFTGNYPPQAMLEACYCEDAGDIAKAEWFPLTSKLELRGDSHNPISVNANKKASHIRLHIYPDGGIARLRVYGEVAYTPPANERIEVSGLGCGGRILAYSDAHYGNVASLLAADRAKNMGDGWETRRRRVPGHDWIIISTAFPAVIEAVEIDTAFYKGNYPAQCSIQAARVAGKVHLDDIIRQAQHWEELLPKQDLAADQLHRYAAELSAQAKAADHFRLNIYPDGGVARLRLFGKPA